MTAEPLELPASPTRFALHFLRYRKWGFLIMFLAEAGQAGCTLWIPRAVKEVIDGIAVLSVDARTQALDLVWDGVLLFIFLNLGILFFSRLSGTLLVIVGPTTRARVRFSLFAYLQHHSPRYFSSHFSGSLAHRISEVAASVMFSLWVILFDFWPVVVSFAFSLVLLWWASTGLAMVLLAWMIPYVVISFVLARRCRHYAKEYAAARSSVSGKIVDSVTNMMNSKLFAQLGHERALLERSLDHEVSQAQNQFWFMEKIRWFQYTAAGILTTFMLYQSIRLYALSEITIGELAMAISVSIAIINVARTLSRRFMDFFEYLGNITDGLQVIVRPHEIVDAPNARDLQVTAGRLDFDRVSFTYDEGKEVFRDLTVQIPPGERVGLVGFSGSGKTTFVHLALRFFDPQSGCVKIDGQPLAEVTQDSLRRQVAMIPQDPILFHRSLMDNIRYGDPDASDEAVYEAARQARADDFIRELPEGYGSLVGERGIKLSGGQRQRIAIARAFLKNAPILLMDEATSSLDSVTEREIQEVLVRVMEGRTVVVIAHRLSTIAHLDRVLVFRDGEIIEDGSHAELLASRGHYAHLWEMQAGGFLPDDETVEESLTEEDQWPS